MVGGVAAFFAAGLLRPEPMKQDYRPEILSPVAVRSVTYDPQMPSVPGLPGTVDLRDAAKTAVPAVVHVTTTQMGREYLGNPLLDYFFGITPRTQEVPQRTGIGSGVIISEDGYIITNNHVIDRSDRIKVTLSDKQEYEASVVGRDANTDIAVIKIEEKGLPFLRYADSDAVELGEWVLAVGNPFNLASTVTAGIISAKARELGGDRSRMSLESFLQTDAAVNSGNSGGALVNAHGELIGINTAIGSPSGTFTGYAFAVPSNIVRKVVDDLRRFGTVQRAAVGVSMQELTQDAANELGISEVGGIYLHEIISGGAAEKSGLKKGDIIKAINGIEVKTAPAFQGQLAKYNPGDKVKMTVLRSGKRQEFEVTLQDMASLSEKGLMEAFGITVKPLTQAERSRLRLNAGVRIENIGRGPLAQTGLREGYIIVKMNNRLIRDLDDFQAGLAEAEDDGVLITAVSPRGKVEYFAFSLQ